MFEAWSIGVRLFMQTNASAAFSRLGQSAAGASANINTATNAVNNHNAALQRYYQQQQRVQQLQSAVQLGFGAVALAGAAALSTGVKGAAELQTSMVTIQNATGATADQMDRLRDKAYELSSLTAQSVADSANIMAVMARSGFNDVNKLLAIAKPAALFADVQFLSRGVPFTEGATQAIQLAHLFRAYTPDKSSHMFDMMTKLSMMMPDNLNRAITQLGYYMPMAKALSVPDDQALVLMAFMDRLGLGRGKGGTGLANFLHEQLLPAEQTTHREGARKSALQDLGLVDMSGRPLFYNSKTDQFNMIGALQAMSAYRDKHSRMEFLDEIGKAFHTNAGRIAMLFSDNAKDPNSAAAQLAQMLRQLNKMPGTDTMQKRYMNTVAGQFQLFVTNFKSLLTDIMWPWLNTFKTTLGHFAEDFHKWQVYLHNHPAAKKAIGGALMGGTALFGLGALLVGGRIGGLVLRKMLGMGEEGTALGHLIAPAVGGAKGAAGMAGNLGLRALWLGSIRGLWGDLGILVNRFKMVGIAMHMNLGSKLGILIDGAKLLAPWILRLGVRIFGIVGWVMTAIDIMKFFTQHPKDIGWWVGEIVGLFKYKLIPGTLNVLGSWVSEIVGAFSRLMQAIVANIVQFVTNPGQWSSSIEGAVGTWFKHAAEGYAQGAAGQNPGVPSNITINLHSATSNPREHASMVGNAVMDALRNPRSHMNNRGAVPTYPTFSTLMARP